MITVQRQDATGNPVNTASPQTITVSSSSTGPTWFTNSICTVVATGGNFTIPLGMAAVNLFYLDTRAGTPLISVANSSGLANPAPQSQTVNAGVPAVLAFTTPARIVDALACTSAASTVQTRDAYGNPSNVAAPLTVGLATSPAALNGRIALSALCGATVTGVQIPTGANQASFFFSADNAGMLSISASATGYIGASQSHTVNPAQPTRLILANTAAATEAGACTVVRVSRHDALNRPTTPANATAVGLSVAPATGLRFFSDSACTLAVTGVSIAGGAGFTDFYAKGTTDGTYGLTATSGVLTSGTSSVQVLPMVRRGTCTIASAATEVTCAVTPAIPGNDISRTMLLVAASNAAATPDEASVACRLTTTAGVHVVCSRPTAGLSTAEVSWQTVSFASSFANGGVSVQHFSGAWVNGTPGVIPVPLTAVDLTKSFVLFSMSTSGNVNGSGDFLTAKLISSTAAELNRLVGASFTLPGTWALQVVSFAGASVLRGTTSSAANVALITIPVLATASLTRTFALFSAGTTLANDTDDICKRTLRGVVTDATTLSFTRGNATLGACVDTPIAELAWERVELPAGALVQMVNVTHPTGTATGMTTFATAVDLSRTVAFTAGQGQGGQAFGESDFGGVGNDIIGANQGTPTLAANSVTITRPAVNLGSATFTAFVVQFTP